ncbi:HAD family hydrolase [Streptomyces sp. HUAS TT3]|uniref:HAD family hydrolase n=1 Tax=Streptomyces sp. HUAS TT3 TaxID=3447510 RepID=UPI003F65C2AB
MDVVRAVVSDPDGVLLAAAARHAAAWKETFDGCLAAWQHPDTDEPPRAFGAVRDYRELLDGRSRLDGVRAFLAARSIDLPAGVPGDPPGCGTVHAVAARKEQIFSAMVPTEGAEVFEDVRPALLRLRETPIARAAASASRPARALLPSADLTGFFTALVDGDEAAALALPGEPAPAPSQEATDRLGAGPEYTAAGEDALVGVEAGRRGGFRLVVGIGCDGDPSTADALRAHGAGLVLPDLSGLPALLGDGRP